MPMGVIECAFSGGEDVGNRVFSEVVAGSECHLYGEIRLLMTRRVL